MPGEAINEDRIREVFMNLDGWDSPITSSHVKKKNLIQRYNNKHYQELLRESEFEREEIDT